MSSSFINNDRQSVSEILNQVEWNQQSISSFQNAVQSSPITNICINGTVRIRDLLYTWSGYQYAMCIIIQDYQISGGIIPQARCLYQSPVRDCPNTSGTVQIHMIASNLLFTIISIFFTK